MKKYFLSKKNILLKHSGVRSYFEAFTITNTTVQSDFDFVADFETMIFLSSKLCVCMYFFLLSLSLTCIRTRIVGVAT